MMDGKEFEKENVFGLGEENSAYAQYFTGASFLNPLTDPEKTVFMVNVTFEPGCRNNWHIHHASNGGGQILICTAGEGWYQEEGREAVSLVPGTVITIPANVKHWHGAKRDSWFSHIAVEVPGEGSRNEWCERVSDEEYAKLGRDVLVVVADHPRPRRVDTVIGDGPQSHPYLGLPAGAVLLRGVRAIIDIIYEPAALLHLAPELAVDPGEGVLVEVSAVEPGLVGYDYDEITGRVEPRYRSRNVREHIELVWIVAVRDVLGQCVVAVDEHRSVAEELLLDDAGHDVAGAEVAFLHVGGLDGGDDDRAVRDLLHPPVVAGEGHRDSSAGLGLLHGEDDVLGVARGGQSDEHVALLADALDLPLEDYVVAVVVADRGDRRDVGQAHAGERGALHHVPAGELGRDVLGVGGRTAVPAEDYLVAVAERVDEHVGGFPDLGRVDLRYCLSCFGQLRRDCIVRWYTSRKLCPGART